MRAIVGEWPTLWLNFGEDDDEQGKGNLSFCPWCRSFISKPVSVSCFMLAETVGIQGLRCQDASISQSYPLKALWGAWFWGPKRAE